MSDHDLQSGSAAAGPAGASATAAVELVSVTKAYGDSIALHPTDLPIRDGEFLSLLGPSGCGKTTTLKLIAGFEQPTDGAVMIGGKNASTLPPHKRDVNTVFQNYALFPHMSVLDNVAYGLKQRKIARGDRRRQALEALEMVGLANRADSRPQAMSGGQQQRVALARALVLRPRVLLLDEPLGALDLKLRQQMQIELKRIHREVGITFVFVTHDQSEALSMSDRVAVMNAGRIEQLAEPQTIYDRPASAFVAGFIGEMNTIEGTLQADGQVTVRDTFTVTPALVVEPARTGSVVTLGVRPRDVQIREDRSDSNGVIVDVMTIGHDLQIVAQLDSGTEVLAVQDRYVGGETLDGLARGVRVRIEPTSSTTLLLGPVSPIHDTAEETL